MIKILYVSIQKTNKEQVWYDKEFIVKMAKAVSEGGAEGLKIEGLSNILYLTFNRSKYVPIIGIIKIHRKGSYRYITPTMIEVRQLMMLLNKSYDMIEVDMTHRDGYKDVYKRFFIDVDNKIKIISAISTIEEAEYAIECGSKWISTTLRGYTWNTSDVILPDINFIKKLNKLNVNIIAEGGYSTHKEYKKALEYGAKIVCIGSAITRPDIITERIINENT